MTSWSKISARRSWPWRRRLVGRAGWALGGCSSRCGACSGLVAEAGRVRSKGVRGRLDGLGVEGADLLADVRYSSATERRRSWRVKSDPIQRDTDRDAKCRLLRLFRASDVAIAMTG